MPVDEGNLMECDTIVQRDDIGVQESTRRCMGTADKGPDKGLRDQFEELVAKYHLAEFHVGLEYLGVHPHIRGGVYPKGARVEALAKQVLSCGFSKEKAEHKAYCVAEFMPPPSDYQTFHEFNTASSNCDERLKPCFTHPQDIVVYGALSHTHLILMLNCIRNQAELEWPDQYKASFNRKGGVDWEYIKDRWPELYEVLTRGIKMTVLKSDIMIDHPEACSLISDVLNFD